MYRANAVPGSTEAYWHGVVSKQNTEFTCGFCFYDPNVRADYSSRESIWGHFLEYHSDLLPTTDKGRLSYREAYEESSRQFAADKRSRIGHNEHEASVSNEASISNESVKSTAPVDDANDEVDLETPIAGISMSRGELISYMRNYSAGFEFGNSMPDAPIKSMTPIDDTHDEIDLDESIFSICLSDRRAELSSTMQSYSDAFKHEKFMSEEPVNSAGPVYGVNDEIILDELLRDHSSPSGLPLSPRRPISSGVRRYEEFISPVDWENFQSDSQHKLKIINDANDEPIYDSPRKPGPEPSQGRQRRPSALSANEFPSDDSDSDTDSDDTRTPHARRNMTKAAHAVRVKRLKRRDPGKITASEAAKMASLWKRFRIPGSTEKFGRLSELARHEKEHRRPWKCHELLCMYHEFGWPTEKELDRHVDKEHPASAYEAGIGPKSVKLTTTIPRNQHQVESTSGRPSGSEPNPSESSVSPELSEPMELPKPISQPITKTISQRQLDEMVTKIAFGLDEVEEEEDEDFIADPRYTDQYKVKTWLPEVRLFSSFDSISHPPPIVSDDDFSYIISEDSAEPGGADNASSRPLAPTTHKSPPDSSIPTWTWRSNGRHKGGDRLQRRGIPFPSSLNTKPREKKSILAHPRLLSNRNKEGDPLLYRGDPYASSLNTKPRENRRKVLRVQINGADLLACPDSGSEKNIISKACAIKHGFRIRRKIKDRKRFEVGNGNIVWSIGRVLETVDLPGSPLWKKKRWFYVLEDCPVPLVMGMSFLREAEILTKYRHLLENCPEDLSNISSLLWIGSPKNRLRCTLDGRQLEAVADTGSDINVMSLACAEREGFRIDGRPEARTKIAVGNGEVIETLGQVYVSNLTLDWREPEAEPPKRTPCTPATATPLEPNIPLQQRDGDDDLYIVFHVIENLPCDIIFGHKFLDDTDAFNKCPELLDVPPSTQNRQFDKHKQQYEFMILISDIFPFKRSSKKPKTKLKPPIDLREQHESKWHAERHRRSKNTEEKIALLPLGRQEAARRSEANKVREWCTAHANCQFCKCV